MIHVKAFSPVAAAIVSVFAAIDPSFWLGVGALLFALVFGPRWLKNRDLKSDNEAKDRTIQTLEQAIAALDLRVKGLGEDLTGAQKRADLAEERVADLKGQVREWRSRYDERAAGASLSEVKDVLQRMAEHQERRDGQIETQFRHLEDAIKLLAGAR